MLGSKIHLNIRIAKSAILGRCHPALVFRFAFQTLTILDIGFQSFQFFCLIDFPAHIYCFYRNYSTVCALKIHGSTQSISFFCQFCNKFFQFFIKDFIISGIIAVLVLIQPFNHGSAIQHFISLRKNIRNAGSHILVQLLNLFHHFFIFGCHSRLSISSCLFCIDLCYPTADCINYGRGKYLFINLIAGIFFFNYIFTVFVIHIGILWRTLMNGLQLVALTNDLYQLILIKAGTAVYSVFLWIPGFLIPVQNILFSQKIRDLVTLIVLILYLISIDHKAFTITEFYRELIILYVAANDLFYLFSSFFAAVNGIDRCIREKYFFILLCFIKIGAAQCACSHNNHSSTANHSVFYFGSFLFLLCSGLHRCLFILLTFLRVFIFYLNIGPHDGIQFLFKSRSV